MGDFATLSRAWVRSPAYVDITPRQIAVLSLVCDEAGPHHVRTLAQRMGTSKPVVTRAHNTLANLGLMTSTQDPEDRRSVVLLPTSEGMKLREAIKDLVA